MILNSENFGYSKGNNQGLKIAEGEYIAFLNNDILLYPNWFEECEKIFLKEKVGFISPKHINPCHKNTDEHRYINFFKKQKYKKTYEKNFIECSFACVVTRKDVLDKIGNFDENFSPAFFEDNDIKYRAIEAGYGVFVMNNVCFYHFGSTTSKNHTENFEKNRNYYYSKHPFGEYLSTTEETLYKTQSELKIYNSCLLKSLFLLSIVPRKIKNRLKKILK